MTPEEINRLIELSKQLTANLAAAAEYIASIQTMLQDLEQAGMTTAYPTYREGKYLYLVTRMQDGRRTRHYIGKDPVKIQAALDRITRQQQHDEIQARLDAYTRRLNSVTYDLRHMVDNTNPKGK